MPLWFCGPGRGVPEMIVHDHIGCSLAPGYDRDSRYHQANLEVRNRRVMMDADLAMLYGVPTKRLNEQVKRNLRRFPKEFMFRATADEATCLRSQFATLDTGRGRYRKYAPYLFTEHGALMLASVLNSPRAIEVSVMIVEVFVQMRHAVTIHAELAERIDELESRLGKHDSAIAAILSAIRRLGQAVPSRSRPIGFTADLEQD